MKENDSIYRSVSDNDAPESTTANNISTMNAAVRLHFLAGRLMISLNDSTNALSHLRIAAAKTKKWPSMHLAIQRVLLECEKKCDTAQEDTYMKLLFEPNSCNILSRSEITHAEQNINSSGRKEVIWTDDDNGAAKPPLDFAVTFLDSTHAISGDTVLACVSVQSRINFPVHVESIQLNTTAGNYNITDLQRHVKKKTIQSWIRNGSVSKDMVGEVSNEHKGVQLKANELVFFFTEMKLPSSLIETALGLTAADLSKFYPKSGKLCNMGFTVAGELIQILFSSLLM